jgi:F-type H+-transporting ATPase subunit b
MQQFLMDEYFWLTLSFILFVGLLYKFAIPAINLLLDNRIEEIKKNIKTSESLRTEAQEMLAQYQRKQKDAVKESEKIIADAKLSAKKFQEKVESEMDEAMARRENQLEERLARMEQNAIQHIQKHAAQIAMAATAQIIAEKLDKTIDARLVEQSIANLDGNIH